MESNQELFRQAILDAKAVRETSLAAARTTLAEHFEPMVRGMFKETVEEIEEAESTEKRDNHAEKAGKKVAKDIEWDEKHHKMHESDMEESTLDEILAELDALSEDSMEDGLEEAHVTTTAGYDEKAHTAKGNTNGSYSEKAGATHGSTNGSYSEKAKSSIHEAEEDDDTEEDDKDAKFDDKAEKAGEDLTKGIEGGHDHEAEEEGTDEQEVVDITVGELKDIIRDVFMTLQGGEAAEMDALDADTDLAADLGTDMTDMANDEEEISLDEILAELEAEEQKKVEEGAATGAIPGGEVDPKAADTYKVEEMKKDLNEAVRTIKALKTELNEMNLFNAKMLYVNKIFKAKNLNESQKTKVINAFDRATSVKEVENTYKTLLESVSVETKKSSLKESVGFASKPIGNAPARPIVEADAFVTRWQTLAGIK
jgi:hypothetical protein